MKRKYKTINGKRIQLHRYIMEQHLGRKLSVHEIVHHKNNDCNDNHIDNLQLMTSEEHSSLHGGKKKNYPKNCKRNRNKSE